MVGLEQAKGHAVPTYCFQTLNTMEHSRHLELRSWSWKTKETNEKDSAEQSPKGKETVLVGPEKTSTKDSPKVGTL